jgi:hypothetical protein
MTAVWEWQEHTDDKDTWNAYETKISNKIEDAYAAKKDKCRVDDERYIDLKVSCTRSNNNNNKKKKTARLKLNTKPLFYVVVATMSIR